MVTNVPGLVCVVILYVIIMAVGIYAAWSKRKIGDAKRSEVIMVAKRDIGWALGSFTMIATWVGGGYINGSAEATYAPGLGLLWTQAPIGLTLGVLTGATFLSEKMRNSEYITMLDPLQNKLGSKMGALLYLPPLTGDLFWSASILSALGSTLSVIIGIDINAAVIISACISVLYTLVGGLYAVAYTDVVQLSCMFFGLFLAVPFAAYHPAVTPIGLTAHSITPNITDGWLGSWSNEHGWQWFDLIIMLTGGGVPWQVYYQRVLSCKSAKQAKVLSYIAVVGCLVLTVPAVLIGAIGASTDWNQTTYGLPSPAERNQSGFILPIVLQHLTPTPVAIIGLAAISAAVMSSTDSSILSASTMFSRNVYVAVFRKNASDRELVWILRLSVVVLGTVACVLALVVKSVYALFVMCADFVFVALFPPLMAVFYVDINTYGALPAFILAFVLRLGGGEPSFGMEPYINYPGGSNFPFRTFAMLVSTFVLISFSYAARYLFFSGFIPAEYDVFKCRLATGGRNRYNNQTSDEEMKMKDKNGNSKTTMMGLHYANSDNSIVTKM